LEQIKQYSFKNFSLPGATFSAITDQGANAKVRTSVGTRQIHTILTMSLPNTQQTRSSTATQRNINYWLQLCYFLVASTDSRVSKQHHAHMQLDHDCSWAAWLTWRFGWLLVICFWLVDMLIVVCKLYWIAMLFGSCLKSQIRFSSRTFRAVFVIYTSDLSTNFWILNMRSRAQTQGRKGYRINTVDQIFGWKYSIEIHEKYQKNVRRLEESIGATFTFKTHRIQKLSPKICLHTIN
jgi:hypothetical protein